MNTTFLKLQAPVSHYVLFQSVTIAIVCFQYNVCMGHVSVTCDPYASAEALSTARHRQSHLDTVWVLFCFILLELTFAPVSTLLTVRPPVTAGQRGQSAH